jgi:hypothetical protein
MTSATAEPDDGPGAPLRSAFRLKHWIAVGVVFGAQVLFAFWLGNPPPPKTVNLPPVPIVHLVAAGDAVLLALQDPTLFILPHRDNFSGDAWMKMKDLTYAPAQWTEPVRPLELPKEQLGAAFVAFMQTNRPQRFQMRIDLTRDTAAVDSAPLTPIAMPSRLLVEGDLAQLRLLAMPKLPPQTNADLLTNTVINLVVDGKGQPFSAVISASSGKPEADLDALNKYAKALRFAPREEAALGVVPANKTTAGRLIFEWQTFASNAPPANP